MPLEKLCEAQINKTVFVLPVIGFGWSKKTATSTFADEPIIGIDPPSPFSMRIVKFHFYEGEIRAASGVVEDEWHPLQGLWVGLLVRDGGGEDYRNFTSKLTRHNVHIGASEPEVEIGGPSVPMVEWIQFKESENLSGIAYVAESQSYLAEIYERLRKAYNYWK